MDKILEVKNLKISFRTQSGILKAVRDISFDLERGKTLAIVGESGSGKSVTSKAILGILAGNSIVEGGKILYDGKDLIQITEDDMYKIRGDKISMIFQDPLSSLNPIVKIGKQITEAMLLKNKANRKEARREFNNLLSILKKNMIDAGTGVEKAKIEELINTFDKFNIEGNRLALAYNEHHALADELNGAIADFSFKLSKKQNLDVKRMLGDFIKKLSTINNPFLIKGLEQEKQSALDSLSAARDMYRKNADLPEEFFAKLQVANDFLSKLASQESPNFFRIGFYKMGNPSVDLNQYTNEELAEISLKYLDDNFMREFRARELEGIKYSFNKALEAKKLVLDEIAEAKKFYLTDFEKGEAYALAKKLSDTVEKSIDRLEIVKDSAAYTFRIALNHTINSYFECLAKNPKEAKRFEKQTKKRDALIARGKNVTWKVVPQVYYDPDDLKANILSILERVEERYIEFINSVDSVDFEKKCIELIDYLKEKASQVVYKVTKKMAREKAIKLMDEVGIHEPRKRFYQYPFEFSGGMRQRIVIAIALAANPDILICDEPTTALDVTIQAQILELINKLKKERNLSVIFITHDLGVVANMADDIAVMYAGKIVEYGSADEIFYDPRHPYTWALLSAMPDHNTKEKLDTIPGTPPNMVYPPVGDAFAERNKYALAIDFEQHPPFFEVSPTHKAATWLLHPNAPKFELPAGIAERIARMKKEVEEFENGRN